MNWVNTTLPPGVNEVAEHACFDVLRLAPPGRQFGSPLRLLVDDTELPTICPHW